MRRGNVSGAKYLGSRYLDSGRVIPAVILNPRTRDPSQDSRLGVPLRLLPAFVQHLHRGLPRACLPRITLRPTAGAAQSAPPVPRRVLAPLRNVAHAASAPCATVPSRWRFSAPCWRRRASGTALRPLPAPCKAGRSCIAHRNGARHSQRPAQSATARRRAHRVHCAESWSPPAKAPPVAETAPATIAWPPEMLTCCTVTTCRPPFRIRRRGSAAR